MAFTVENANGRSIAEAVDRFVRQQDLVNRQRLSAVTASVIGVGAIGRHVALQLAAIGAPKIQLFDFDRVEDHNVTTQGYRRRDVGTAKVEATAATIREIDPGIDVLATTDRFRPRHKTGNVVFCCVDSISARTAIWKHLRNRIEFWSDGRMLGEVIRILTAPDSLSRQAYARSLFDQAEAQTGSCTSRSTIYAAGVAAGLMIHQFTRWLRQLSLDSDLSLNLLTSELTVAA